MKLKEILDIEKPVYSLADILLSTPEENRRVYTLLKKIIPEIENYKVQFGKILVKYGTHECNGQYAIEKTNVNYGIAIKEISELQNLEIEIEFNPVKVHFEELNLSAADVFALEKAGVVELKEGV